MTDIQLDIEAEEWDRELAAFGGHPWQSAYWGTTQKQIEGVNDRRIRLRRDGRTIQLVRIEERHLPRLGKLAWIRRGPVAAELGNGPPKLEPEIASWLAREGFCLAVSSPWQGEIAEKPADEQPSGANETRTIWIDLTLGKERLWDNLQRYFRHNVGRAQRKGVVVETTRDPARIADYADLYHQLGETKGFEIRSSRNFISTLVQNSCAEHAGAHLFLATHEGDIAAGAMICRIGRSIHYMNGVSNRKLSKLRPAEALHWAIIEWGIAQGCTRYDLEGIDAKGNPGVYAFKKKMGGDEIILAPRQVMPLTVTGRLLKPVAGLVLNSGSSGLQSLAQGLWKRPSAA